jgi:transposase-like protein
MKVFNDLRTSGVLDILIAVTDGLTGMPAALEAVFPQTILDQAFRCHTNTSKRRANQYRAPGPQLPRLC